MIVDHVKILQILYFSCIGTNVQAYYDRNYLTIRHSHCEWLLPGEGSKVRCPACAVYRDSLRSKLRSIRLRKDDVTAASSHTPYSCLSTPETHLRMRNLHTVVVKQSRELRTISERLERQFSTNGVRIEGDIQNGIIELLKMYKSQAVDSKNKEEDSFKLIFWNQQILNASQTNKKQIRWHPLIIRWALYLHHRSSGAYETLRDSGVISLPSSRTLRDYRHFTSTKPGFSTIADIQLHELMQLKRPTKMAKYVFLLIDEIYLKEGLVYSKSTGSLIGFSDLGGIPQQLDDLERKLASDTPSSRPLAKTMMVIMVRGVFCDIKFPYAQFPMSDATADDLFPLVWQAIDRLECAGIHVLGITADGASINRRLFKMHSPKKKLVHKTANVYASDNRSLFFFSDPPHLIKTVRNAFASSIRNLWVSDMSSVKLSPFVCVLLVLWSTYKMEVHL